MFEKIVLRRSDNGPAITAGELAEALLFYQNVHLVLDYGSLTGLISQIGMQRLVSLLTLKNMSAVYCENSLAVRTDSSYREDVHEFIAYSLVGDQEYGEVKSKKDFLKFFAG